MAVSQPCIMDVIVFNQFIKFWGDLVIHRAEFIFVILHVTCMLRIDLV